MIQGIRLQNFRSYKDDSFEFDESVNIVVGPNGSGKTNLLEAVLVLATGASYRAKDVELIKFDHPWARLDAWFGDYQRVVKLSTEEQKPPKQHLINDKPYLRLSLSNTVPVVLFEPDQLQLLTHGPRSRRDYFDDILERTQAGYKQLLAKYRRALVQRNALLKQPESWAASQIFAWNIRLSELGSQIAEARMQLIDEINKSISKVYSRIANKKTAVGLVYETPFARDNYSSKLLSKLEASTTLDFARGFTAYGPHREDIIIYIRGEPAEATASRGEIRSLVLALKIIELKMVETAREQKPVFLLDDVFSELDSAHQNHLVENLKGYQAIITTTNTEAVIEYFASGNHRLISLVD